MDIDIQKRLYVGLINGVIQTTLFNPIDRTLYLMVKHKRSFFNSKNWKNPYQGLENALLQRTISYGLYFPFYDYFNKLFNNDIMMSGLAVGITTAFLTNPISSVKYHHWGKKDNELLKYAISMYRDKGMKPFLKGIMPLAMRDSIFSIFYATLSNKFRPKVKGTTKDFIVDTGCAMASTTFSAPFNYFRNRMFMDGHHKHHTAKEIITEFINHLKDEKSLVRKILFVQNRFVIGFGTLRVGLGMALSRKTYDFLLNI